MREKGMYSMTPFVHHSNQVPNCSCRVHKYEGDSRFSQWAIVTTRRFSNPAFKIQPPHINHRPDTITKERKQLTEDINSLICELLSGFKGMKRLDTFGL